MTESTDQRKRILHVSKFIMENFDEIHNRFTATDVLDYLGELNIRADRRAIYGDIAALSEVWDDYEIESVPRGAFYVRSRPFTFADLCLIAQCVYAAKFISDEQAEILVDIIGDFGSKAEKEELLKEVKTISRVERAQTGQKNTLAMVGIIIITSINEDTGSLSDMKYACHTSDQYEAEGKSLRTIYDTYEAVWVYEVG